LKSILSHINTLCDYESYTPLLFSRTIRLYTKSRAPVYRTDPAYYIIILLLFFFFFKAYIFFFFFPCSPPVGRKHFSPATNFTYSRYATNAARSIRAAAQRSFIMIFSPPFDANALAGKHRLTYQTDVFLSCRLDLLPWPQT